MALAYKKGSYNRMWAVLSVLAYKKGQTTLMEVSELTGFPRSSAEDILKKILDNQVPGLVMKREGTSFTIEDWGSVVNPDCLRALFHEHVRLS